MASTETSPVMDAARLEASGNLLGALAALSMQIAANPDDLSAWTRVGMIHIRLLKWQQAAGYFELVLQKNAAHADALHGLAVARYHLGDMASSRELADAAAAAAPNEPNIHATRAYVHATTLCDPAHTLAVYREWGARFADPLTARAKPLPPLDAHGRSPTRRLRVGYVSGDMRQHSMAYFIEPIFANHDAASVEVHVFNTGRRDGITERLQANVKHWHDVGALSEEKLHALIRSLRIDVLVDLSGHTEGQRLRVFARRAAPVQVTWLGFMHPLGMKAMDYRLTDLGMNPAGTEGFYDETLFRLNCMATYSPPDSPLLEQAPMVENGFPTLISLNNSKKVTDRMLRLWGRILEARPDAQLIVMVQEINAEDANAQMLPRLERLGLPLNRVHVSPQVPIEGFMALGTVADVALDTSPVSGGTTTLHSLWMGLPVVALDALEGAESSTARTLEGLGYPAWVAPDEDGYVQRVLALLEDPAALAAHRINVRERMAASVVMDYRTRTAELERAYRLMWINHLLGEPRFVSVGQDPAAALAELSRPPQQTRSPGGKRRAQRLKTATAENRLAS